MEAEQGPASGSAPTPRFFRAGLWVLFLHSRCGHEVGNLLWVHLERPPDFSAVQPWGHGSVTGGERKEHRPAHEKYRTQTAVSGACGALSPCSSPAGQALAGEQKMWAGQSGHTVERQNVPVTPFLLSVDFQPKAGELRAGGNLT